MRKLSSSTSFLQKFALIGMLVAAPCSASTVYTNFGPGDSFNSSSAYVIGGGSASQFAIPFFPTQGGVLNFLRLAVDYDSGSSTVNDFTVRLTDDASGLPGSAIETITGLVFNPDVAAILTVNAALTSSLDSSLQYWIVLSATNAATTRGRWYYNDQGIVGVASGTGGPFSFGASAAPTLEVDAIPEPATMGLFLVGAGLMGWRLRKRRA